MMTFPAETGTDLIHQVSIAADGNTCFVSNDGENPVDN